MVKNEQSFGIVGCELRFLVKFGSSMVDRGTRDGCMMNNESSNTSECSLMDDESR